MTALVDTLFQLEKYLGLELDSLLPYAEADDIGGYYPDASQAKWGAGAVWEVEGQTLYALIRALKPETVLEIGGGTGCSTNHIASALKANGSGHLVTLDRGNTPRVFDDLKPLVDVRNDDAINYLALQPDNSIDFLLEDADHTEALCAAIGELAKTKLRPGGVLMVHDAVHPTVGAGVRAGYDLAGLDFRTYLTDPSDCGWLVWQRPGVPTNRDIQEALSEIQVESFGTFSTLNVEGLAASLADTEPVLQAQEDEFLNDPRPDYSDYEPLEDVDKPPSVPGWKPLPPDEPIPDDVDTVAMHPDTWEVISTELEKPPAKKKVVRKAKPKAKK